MTAADTIAIGYTSVVGGVQTGMVAKGVLAALVQLLLALVGAVLISAAVQGFKAEWQALFKRPFGGAAARILIYVASGMFQLYNWYIHGFPTWELVVLTFLTAFSATGIYHFAGKRTGESD
jgi:hypothetical protein